MSRVLEQKKRQVRVETFSVYLYKKCTTLDHLEFRGGEFIEMVKLEGC